MKAIFTCLYVTFGLTAVALARNGWDHMTNPWSWIGMLIWAAFLILIIWLVFSWGKGRQTPYSEEKALDILKKRYAKGEISREEYERMRKDIEG